MRNVIDSSVWIETFVRGRLGGEVSDAVEGASLVPSIVILEVAKWLRRRMPADVVNEFAAMLAQNEVIPLDAGLALAAAEYGLKRRLALADSVIYATAQIHDATLWTMDAHFAGLPGVRMVRPA